MPAKCYLQFSVSHMFTVEHTVAKEDTVLKMVRYTISFLISFKQFNDNDVLRTTETNIDTTTHSILNIGQSACEDEEDLSYHLFRPFAERRKICNIIYSLPTFGGNFMECRLTVACWSEMFKVYSRTHDVTFKTERYGGNTWAGFTVQHIYDEGNFETSDLKTFFSKSVEFRFSVDPEFLLKRSNTKKLGKYWCSLKSEDNATVFEPLEQLFESIVKSRSMKSNQSTITIHTRYKPSMFRKKLSIFREPVLCKGVQEIHTHKLIKTMKNLEDDCITANYGSRGILQLPGSYLFHDKPVWIIQNDKPLSSNIERTYVFVSTYSFLDDNSRMTLRPFTIILESLKNLPKEEMRSKGVKKLCVEYVLDPIIPKTRTMFEDWNGQDKLQLRSLKCFLTDSFHPLTVISTLQSKKMVVRILGKVLNYSEPTKIRRHGLFGSDFYDDRFSLCIKTQVNNKSSFGNNSKSPKDPKQTMGMPTSFQSGKSTLPKRRSKTGKDEKLAEALLGIAQIDLSPLVSGRSCVLASELVSSRPYVTDRQQTEDELFGHFNINEAHTDSCNYEHCLLKNSSLMRSCTLVKITAKCRYLLTPQVFKDNYSLNEAYSRAIAIITDKQFAANVLKSILMINSEALNMRTYNLPLVPLRKMLQVPEPNVDSRSLEEHKYSTDPIEEDLEDGNKSIIIKNTIPWFTGFCIDCVDMVIMFIEGPTVNAFPALLTELVNIKPDQGTIMYSSDLIYDSRFYATLKEVGGIYCITMKRPVNDLVKMESTLRSEYAIPEPARKALNKISKLISSKTVLEVVQENYLPQPDQLISFDIEFGLPHSIQS